MRHSNHWAWATEQQKQVQQEEADSSNYVTARVPVMHPTLKRYMEPTKMES